MEIPKPSEDDKDYFRSLVPKGMDVETKPMFGNLGGFVNGNMFMGVFGPNVGIKLNEPDRARLLAQSGAGPFGPEGRPMSGYVALPARWRTNPAKARPWIKKAYATVAALPPKKKPAKRA